MLLDSYNKRPIGNAVANHGRTAKRAKNMTYVVTESCIKCKYTDCVDVCPADAFREGPNFLVIAPDDCIDCALCVPECPVSAIYEEGAVPQEQRQFIALNVELAEVWEPIIAKQDALADAAQWAEVKDKRHHLDAEFSTNMR